MHKTRFLWFRFIEVLTFIGAITIHFEPKAGGLVLLITFVCVVISHFVYLRKNKLQYQLQQNKLAQLGFLSAGIVHEIKNPINFINNFSQISCEIINELSDKNKSSIETDYESLSQLKSNLQTIQQHAKRIENTIQSILRQARTNITEYELTDINNLLDEFYRYSYHAMRANNPSFNLHIEKHFDKNLPLITVNAAEIGRVFLNIINNALYAMDNQAINHSQNALILSTELLDKSVIIKIKDNGPGIPKNLHSKVFSPFFTTKPNHQGTGIGLSLCKEIVKKHRGELNLNTEVNEGCEFTIKLPVKFS